MNDTDTYCDECGTDDCDGRYHESYDCPACGDTGSVSVGPTDGNPEDGDTWSCHSCAAEGPW